MLRVRGLKKTFAKGTANEQVALIDLDLHLAAGEFVTIIGSNGAGKSTLFNAIAGSFLCDRGHILLAGQDVTYWPEHRRAKRIGRLFQDPSRGTAPGLTIEENLSLAYARAHRRLLAPARSRQTTALFREKLAKLEMGLENRMRTPVGNLSGGQRQAVALLMSTITEPSVLMLDEHTAALDPLTAEKVLQLTEEIVAERQITTLMITHNIGFALSQGTRTLMMHRGRIVLDLSGERRAQLTVPQLLALYREKTSQELDNDRMLLVQ